jgi:GntR family transcriptional regulator
VTSPEVIRYQEFHHVPESRDKYQVIADDLRAAILRGDLAGGDRMPTEKTLIERYGVAAMTVRQAIAALRAEGLITSRRGSGVYVRGFEPVRRHGSQRLAAEQWGTGRSVWDADTSQPVTVDQLHIHEAPAGDLVAGLLAVEPGTPVWVRSRRYLVAGRPVMLAVSTLPADLVAGTPITEPDTGPGGIYARLADLGHAPAHFIEEIRARMPAAAEIERLSLQPATPVLHIVRRAVTSTGRTVEVNEMVADASAYVLAYDFDARVGQPVDASPSKPEPQPVVAAIVTSERGFLAGRRNDGKPPWTLIAGEIEPGESPEDAAIREVKEETGLLVGAGKVIGRRVHPATHRTMIYMSAYPKGPNLDLFVGDTDELAEVRWLTLAEADELLPGMYEPVRDYIGQRLSQG